MKTPTSFLVALLFFLSLTSPSPAKATPVDKDFTLRSGDVLQITVWKEDGLDREVVVLPDGTLTFPLIGTIYAQGLTPAALQNDIKLRLANLVPDASVTVMVKAPLGHSVSVMGQVLKPGEFIMGRKMSVMQALSQAGGLTPYASESGIIVLRNEDGQKKSISIPYKSIAKGENLDKDIELRSGDVVFVPTTGLF